MGLLLRVAEIQGHSSTDRTAKAAGISRSRLAHGVATEIKAFATQVDQDPARIAADSPNLDRKGRLHLRGHPIGDMLDFARRRVCPACLDEAWYHRFWWDIRAIGTCPRHGIDLVDACACGKAYTWRGGGLLKCSACPNNDTMTLPRTAADPRVLRKDAYLLSRFGAGEAEAVPILDELSLREVFTTLERIGAACEGYSRQWKSAESLGIPLAVLQARGFEVLADDGLDEVLTRIYDGFIALGGRPEEGFTACYGWLYHWFNHKRGAKFSPLLAEAFHAHGAARFPIVPKARLGKLPPAAVKKLSLKAAAAKAGASVYAMKSIGLALELIRTEKRSGSQLSFPVEDVERIARDLKGALSLEETCERLAIGRKAMVSLMEGDLLQPALRGGGRRHDYVFRSQDVDALLAKLGSGARCAAGPKHGLIAIADLGRSTAATIAECVRKILEGRLRVRIRVGGRPGLKGLFIDQDELMAAVAGEVLSFAAAAIRMRLNARGLRKAIDGGLIAGVKPGSKTVPAKAADAFAARFMMLGEIRDRLGGWFPELRKGLQRAGFSPDPDLEKCLCAGYLRSRIEPFVRQIETGKTSLAKPEGSWKPLVREAERILGGAKAPIPSEDLLAKLRRKMTIGPSDQADFFYSAMWDARETFVHVEGAGWWLRARPYLDRAFPLDGPAPTQTEIVDETIIDMLRVAARPLSQEDVLAALKARSIQTPVIDGEVFLRRFFVRHADKLIKLTGLGYWDRARPYPPALYDPKTWSGKTQTAVQRAGLWIMKLIADGGHPLSRAQLEPMLRDRGIIPGKCTRAYVGNAVSEFSDEIVYLDREGYWLARKPWPAAGYRPAGKRQAA
ncbi:TniQ family protein [Bradyrhizobium elkanii]|uniref:TniQ family protein n=2 Tax=Nitrobacteraceae TaxID=41294 RepID=UPI0004B46673|nr:TniQ family protein [Bradyrhizobium elkanii]MCS3445924.1 hypothetical protein [Bradyrhizobium elkanii]MCS3562944.1 hypothetical protein [Bradyrhizobium elkanii]MCW2147220.1 hypothetical protein [Bradyrhizobium elkanii]MCW2353702.1 hypothetical protein [Bradyrhizobium elkanii]MCW2380051.1 hypothetical protein [Bradyrhizobium elkanii]